MTCSLGFKRNALFAIQNISIPCIACATSFHLSEMQRLVELVYQKYHLLNKMESMYLFRSVESDEWVWFFPGISYYKLAKKKFLSSVRMLT